MVSERFDLNLSIAATETGKLTDPCCCCVWTEVAVILGRDCRSSVKITETDSCVALIAATGVLLERRSAEGGENSSTDVFVGAAGVVVVILLLLSLVGQESKVTLGDMCAFKLAQKPSRVDDVDSGRKD